MSADISYFIEFYRLGDFVKVTAIDPVTGLEACATFPARGYPESYMQQRAIALLTRRIAIVFPENNDEDDDNIHNNGGIVV